MKIGDFCRDKTICYQRTVQYCAQLLFKRFYTYTSVTNNDPRWFWLTSVYLASKLEDSIMENIEDFCFKVGVCPNKMRICEMTLLNSNMSNLLPHTPHRAYKGLFQIINKEHTSSLFCPDKLFSFDTKVLSVGILRLIDDSMLTDLLMEFSPGFIVSAALSLACEGKGWICSTFLYLFGNLLSKKIEISSQFKLTYKFKESDLYNILATITRMLRLLPLRIVRIGLGKIMNLKFK
jgi:hypothetical protein